MLPVLYVTAFRDLDRDVRSAIRSDGRENIQERLRDPRSSSLYSVIRFVVAGKRSSAPSLPAATPDEINAYFVNVGPRVAAGLSDLGPPPDIPCRLPRVGVWWVSGVGHDAGRPAGGHVLLEAFRCVWV